MGGTVRLESTAGVGSCFTFTILCGLGTPRAARTLPACLTGMPVLVVDDNAGAREILASALGRFGCAVTTAASAPAALVALRAAASAGTPFALLLTDWQMPEMNGVELARHVQTGDGAPVPKVVIVTAYGREEVRAEAERSGVDGFLLKPVTDSALFDLVTELFSAGPRPPVHHDTAVPRFAGARVLVAEDNEINRQIVTELLTATGVAVETAENGRVAVDRLADSAAPPVDLVLMDLQMPEMDGVTATRHIRRDPRFAALPIIALTAHALAEERTRVLAAGMTEHLSKPIDPDQFYRLLARFLPLAPEAAPMADAAAPVPPLPVAPVATAGDAPPLDRADGLRRVAGNAAL